MVHNILFIVLSPVHDIYTDYPDILWWFKGNIFRNLFLIENLMLGVSENWKNVAANGLMWVIVIFSLKVTSFINDSLTNMKHLTYVIE